ncbi:MAG: amino acid ABC transporter substrate-binding protein, partial [Candidatus Tectomicrobia bacterium]|nr:amino acid ABC transporter substrate-binding protein [Candidatus Tectomicrobia bacterium]
MRNNTIRYASLFVALMVAAVAGAAYAGDNLDAIRARDNIRCGVSTGLAGFAIADSAGNWTGLDV